MTLSAQLINCMSMLRVAHDITDYQIAIRTGLCKSTVRRIMKGEMSVSLSTVDKMMRAFPDWTLELGVKEYSIPMRRADQHCVCAYCGKTYGDHPMSMDELSFDGNPFLHVLCDGTLVKL